MALHVNIHPVLQAFDAITLREIYLRERGGGGGGRGAVETESYIYV
jgi:hypothetical protein